MFRYIYENSSYYFHFENNDGVPYVDFRINTFHHPFPPVGYTSSISGVIFIVNNTIMWKEDALVSFPLEVKQYMEKIFKLKAFL